jgi:hypothetical protein
MVWPGFTNGDPCEAYDIVGILYSRK